MPWLTRGQPHLSPRSCSQETVGLSLGTLAPLFQGLWSCSQDTSGCSHRQGHPCSLFALCVQSHVCLPYIPRCPPPSCAPFLLLLLRPEFLRLYTMPLVPKLRVSGSSLLASVLGELIRSPSELHQRSMAQLETNGESARPSSGSPA